MSCLGQVCGPDMTNLLVGFFILLGAVGVVGGVVLFEFVLRNSELQRRDYRLARGMCLHCGYVLAGNTTGVCPECGKAVNS